MDFLLLLIAKITCICIGIIYLIKSIKKILIHGGNVVNYTYLVFFIFYILPLLLDLIVGPPTLKWAPLYDRSFNDVTTNIIYCCFIIFIIYCFTKTKEVFFKDTYAKQAKINFLKELVVILVCLLPFYLVFFYDFPFMYLIYKDHVDLMLGKSIIPSLIYLTSTISVLLIFINAVSLNYNIKYFIFSLPIIFIDIWLNGKRNIVALVVVFFILLLFKNKSVKKMFKIFIVLFLGISLYFLNSFYQSSIRTDKPEDAYSSLRVDFGRDAAVKAGIYKLINKETERPTLEYPGQSFIFYVTIFIPRDQWKDKPLPYAQYFTSSVLDTEAKMWGWGLTTSFFEEVIANFGFLGFFIGPFIFFKFVNASSKVNNRIFDLLNLLICSILLTVEITAYYILFLFWFLFYFYLYKLKNKKIIFK
ncbi:hypothetical protein [Elizabethkingia meningoseptica]|uniref:hypothetical protein n=1 Tax=Elizabethkingia meningoseptica TaxID=238 RepID=UPI0020129591|nr:hypothetical protein [Elizabethkingia meningoseptica]MCL1675667.1 hypothetical protein [Elizabethkingia meningoseptica]MCL1686917.1 hypothetical protein [Elizabethkingia meningoseptica]